METSIIILIIMAVAGGALYFLRCAECARLKEQHERDLADIEAYRNLYGPGVNRFFVTSSRFCHPGRAVYLASPEGGKSLMLLNVNSGDTELDRTLAEELIDKIDEIESYNDDNREAAQLG